MPPSTPPCSLAQVCDPPGTVLMTGAGREVAGQIGAMSQSYLRQWGNTNGGAAGAVPVACAPLRTLMAKNASLGAGADFLSLDVEGAEEQVIRTVDPARFRVILIELDKHDPAKNGRVIRYVHDAGLRRSAAKNRIGGGGVAFFNRGVPLHDDTREWAKLEARLAELAAGPAEGRAQLASTHREFMFQRALAAAVASTEARGARGGSARRAERRKDGERAHPQQ